MNQQTLRIGHGYDLHRLEPVVEGATRRFILAGVVFDHPLAPVGHSDGDAVYHAVTDAILGGLGQPDIGQAFPDNDPQWQGADSAQFVKHAADAMAQAGYAISNMDITVICEKPKISPHKPQMISNIAQLLGCEAGRINLKGKTHEKVDAVGEGRAVEVHVVVLLTRT